MNKFYWILILVIIVVGGWLLTNQFLNGTKNITSNLDTSTWQEYTNDDWGISLKHPEVVKADQVNANLVKFSVLEPTQSESTEMSDGISMEVAHQRYDGDLKSIVEGRIEESKNSNVEITKPLRKISLGNVDGYTYSFSGLGEFDIYYLPKGEGEYFLISVLAEDSEEQGFEEIAQGMLASFTIN